MTSPTQHTLRELRERGYLPVVVEYFHFYAKQKRDLWGFDIAAIGPDHLLMVQTTASDNLAARVTKLLSLPSTEKLLRAGVRCEAWGWGTYRSREKRVDGKRSHRSEIRLNVREFVLLGGRVEVVRHGATDEELANDLDTKAAPALGSALGASEPSQPPRFRNPGLEASEAQPETG